MERVNTQQSHDEVAVAINDVTISATTYDKDNPLNGSCSHANTFIANRQAQIPHVVSSLDSGFENNFKTNGSHVTAASGDTADSEGAIGARRVGELAFDPGETNITTRVSELEEKLASTIKIVGSLSAHCAILQTTCSQLQVENRTLEENADLMKQEHDRINSRLMSLLGAVAKMSAINGSPRTNPTEGNGEENTTIATNPPTSEAAKVEVSKASAVVQAASTTAQIDLQLQMIKQQAIDNDKAMKLFATRVDGVDSKLDWLETELQRYVRRHSLIIENFCPKEDRSASEIFLLFSNSVLNVSLDESDIDSLHLIEHASSQAALGARGASKTTSAASNSPEKSRLPRPILVTFTCYRARAQVYRAWLTFRSSTIGGGSAVGGGTSKAGTLSGERGQGLCVREFLTEAQDAVYRQATEARDKHLIADCWTFKGKTFLRTAAGEIREFVSTEQSVPKEDSRCSIM